MKKHFYLLILAGAALMLSSCTKELGEFKDIIFTCTTDEGTSLKTSLSGVNVLWNESDRIKVSYLNTSDAQMLSELAPSSIEDGGALAKFHGGVTDVSTSTSFYAVYPSSALSSFDYATASGTLAFPSVQTAANASFGQDANVTTAFADYGSGEPELKFKNMGAIVSFTLNSAASISSVELKSTKDMAGDVNFTISETGVPAIVSVENGSKSVKLEGTFENGGKYYFAVLPGSYDLFEVDFVNAEGKVVKAVKNTACTLERNGNLYLGEIEIPDAAWGNANIAFGRDVTVSSTVAGVASNLIDGNTGSYWQAGSTGTEYVIVDLGKERMSNNVVITWATGAYATSFDVMLSSDGESYQNVYAARGYSCPSDGICSIVYEPTKARYIKIQMNKCVNVWNYTIKEVELYYDLSLEKTPTSNYAKGQTATASSEFYPASNAVMGNEGFYWVAKSHGEEWFQVDLGEELPVESVVIIWPAANAAKSFDIQLSSDGTSFSTVASESSYDPASDPTTESGKPKHTISFTKQNARYVKLLMKEPVSIYDYWINEFEVH
ncbi:MAG: discoidin domain-containing protein [Candidatus Cryptobacteroides sp.]